MARGEGSQDAIELILEVGAGRVLVILEGIEEVDRIA